MCWVTELSEFISYHVSYQDLSAPINVESSIDQCYVLWNIQVVPMLLAQIMTEGGELFVALG